LFETLNEGSFITPPSSDLTPSLLSSTTYVQNVSAVKPTFVGESTIMNTAGAVTQDQKQDDTSTAILPAATKAEKFLLTAMDQESGSRNERLGNLDGWTENTYTLEPSQQH
jgi:hypothetical protein